MLFALHPFVNSSGIRYFPLFPDSEAALVEDFAEDAVPPEPLSCCAPSGLRAVMECRARRSKSAWDGTEQSCSKRGLASIRRSSASSVSPMMFMRVLGTSANGAGSQDGLTWMVTNF